MEDPKKKLMEETEIFMQEVYSDPVAANAEPPEDLHDQVMAAIRLREVEKKEQELIHLQRVYKKRLKLQKYIVIAAIIILVLAVGVVSMGGPERMYEMVKSTLTGREQVNIDSDTISKTAGMSEEEAYQKIEEVFDFTPVRLIHLPKSVGFLEAEIGEEIQCINMLYGENEDVKIIYVIRPNYRESSMGKGIEDDFVEEYIEENEFATVYMRKYMVGENMERWSVQFEYQGVSYAITIMDSSKDEVEQIVENLFFPET